MRYLTALVFAAAVLIAPTAVAAPTGGSCFLSYETAGDLYANTLYIEGVKQKSLRVDIIDTDTETVLHTLYVYGHYVSIEEYLYDVDGSTEFAVYASSNAITKGSGGGSGNLLAECYA